MFFLNSVTKQPHCKNKHASVPSETTRRSASGISPPTLSLVTVPESVSGRPTTLGGDGVSKSRVRGVAILGVVFLLADPVLTGGARVGVIDLLCLPFLPLDVEQLPLSTADLAADDRRFSADCFW